MILTFLTRDLGNSDLQRELQQRELQALSEIANDLKDKGVLTEDDSVDKGHQTMPAIDEERYPEISGLEGPFRMLSGQVVYYSSKKDKYYDSDSDMYLDLEDVW